MTIDTPAVTTAAGYASERATILAAKTLEQSRQQGEDAVALVQAAAQTGRPASSPPGVGEKLDVTG